MKDGAKQKKGAGRAIKNTFISRCAPPSMANIVRDDNDRARSVCTRRSLLCSRSISHLSRCLARAVNHLSKGARHKDQLAGSDDCEWHVPPLARPIAESPRDLFPPVPRAFLPVNHLAASIAQLIIILALFQLGGMICS